jgi:hypothetical protein
VTSTAILDGHGRDCRVQAVRDDSHVSSPTNNSLGHV